MNHAISDHGELDFLTPPEPSDTDKAIAKAAREAIEAHRAWRNDEDAKRLEPANVYPFLQKSRRHD
jgi:hypothetical protein